MTPPNIRDYHGWYGAHFRDQAEGAMPNGTRVEKIGFEEGDQHQPGTKAVVLGSWAVPDQGYAYFVEWEPNPRVAVLVRGHRIRRIDETPA